MPSRVDATDKPFDKKSEKVLRELENIDDEADQLGIGFVKIADETLAEDYNLGALPALVYYRNGIPIVFEGTSPVFTVSPLSHVHVLIHCC